MPLDLHAFLYGWAPLKNGPSFKGLKFRLHPLGYVTDFKYLRYRISEYKVDLENKLQTYNKINGGSNTEGVWKKISKETNLRIHNITAKAALKFKSKAWVQKKRKERRLEAAQMKFLRHLLGITKLDQEKNQYIRGKNESTEHSKGNKTVQGKLATTRTDDGHR
jgi:hypothetical protein